MLASDNPNWWAVGLRGLFALLFGIGAFAWPGITLGALVFLFGFYSIADGIFGFFSAGTLAVSGQRGWLIVEGLLSIASGIIAFVWPSITALALLLLIAAYAFVTGILEIAAAIQIERGRRPGNGWPLVLGGVLSIVFGALLVIWPDTGLLSLVWLIGFYALAFGLMLVAMAYQLYKMQRNSPRQGQSRVRALQ
ncbi:MAG: DUF308 domain-containing protein [Chloroflexi bacterium]|nr:DUF308 domain-containing protein [Chloroflexota bacterium]MBN9397524.1 DUF308 domain-containing protein [Candidatus Melainabacteria bacterium]OJV96493.1 MAG: hypothetical protein BGO39_12165 [Chloroflexi bacterium 54-19]